MKSSECVDSAGGDQAGDGPAGGRTQGGKFVEGDVHLVSSCLWPVLNIVSYALGNSLIESPPQGSGLMNCIEKGKDASVEAEQCAVKM